MLAAVRARAFKFSAGSGPSACARCTRSVETLFGVRVGRPEPLRFPPLAMGRYQKPALFQDAATFALTRGSWQAVRNAKAPPVEPMWRFGWGLPACNAVTGQGGLVR